MSNDSSRSQSRIYRRHHPDTTRHHHATFVYRPLVPPTTVKPTFTNRDDARRYNYRPETTAAEEKASRMKLAETISKKEALLKLPETQSREIFSAYALFEQSTGHRDSPMINLPDPGKSVIGTRMGQAAQRPEGQCGTDDDDESDDTDVEDDLFMKLEQELNNNDDAATRRCLAATKQQHHHPTPVDANAISLPQAVYTFPSDGYFSPGASFLSATETPNPPRPAAAAANTITTTTKATKSTSEAVATPTSGPRTVTTSTTTKSQTGDGRDPPTINVRIVGGEVIMSPAQEHVLWAAPTSTPESSQTRLDEEVFYGAHPFSLRPPPHLSRSRRTSRINPQHHHQHDQQAVTCDHESSSDGTRSRSPASSKNSNTSAVSPRFMALRKLSESGLIPTPSDLNSPDQQLLHKIEEIFEVQLKSSVSEIIWRATESHRDAQRYWQEQKHEILEIGLSILRRLNEQSPAQNQHEKDDELDTLRKERIDLENEMTTLRLKQIEQTAEMEAIKKQNADLLRQMGGAGASGDSSSSSNSSNSMAEVYTKRIEELEDQIRVLKQENGSAATAASKAEKEEVEEEDQQERPCGVDTELQTDTDNHTHSGEDSFSLASGCSVGRTNWADLMGGVSEWELKYRELEARYAKERPKLEQKITALESKLKHKSYTPMTTTAAASEIAAAMSTSSVDRTQRQDRQRKYKSMTSSPQPSLLAPPSSSSRDQQQKHPSRQQQCYYMNEAGHLTFTTEINGRLSQYTVKLPTKESNDNNNNTTATSIHTTSTRLNPHAQPFKASN